MRIPASARSIASAAAKASIGQAPGEQPASEPSAGKQQIGDHRASPEPANDRVATLRASLARHTADESGAAGRPAPGKPARRPDLARFTSAAPKGVAFPIAELLLIQAWSEANDLAMRIHLDHGSRAEEYEEAIAIQSNAGPVGRSLIWRNQTHVHVQPLLGRRRRYASVSAALNSLAPEKPVSVTDIIAKTWPKD